MARASPSGEFCLEIVPDDDLRAGMHGAHYHMTRNGKAVWSGQRDYTLRNPIVTNDGTVVGVAYRSEIKKEDTPRREKSYMHIVAIRDGQDIQDWVQEQGLPSYNLSYTDRPYAKNLVVDPANDRFIVNLVEHGTSQRGHPACWLFRLSDCTFISRIDFPRILAMLGQVESAKVEGYGGASVYITELQVVAGTPLILAHVRLPGTPDAGGGKTTKYDSLFILVNGNGMPLWWLRVPNNITSWEDPSVEDHLMWEPSHALLIAGKPNCFGVFRAATDGVETYRVSSGGTNGWSVTKTGRSTLGKARWEHSVDASLFR